MEIEKKKNKGLRIFIIILAIFIILAVIAAFSGVKTLNLWPGADQSDYPTTDNIAIVNIIGTISGSDGSSAYQTSSYNQTWLIDTLDDLINDDWNKGLILFIDTPGGGVYESDEVYLKVKQYQDETGRPVYVAMGTSATSGGYYIAATADKIFANRNTMTGSIGVTMGTFYDVSELLNKYGIKTKTITSGRNKAMGSSVEPMTIEHEQILRSIIDEAYQQFVEIVAEGREMDIETVKMLADGRIYTAKQALNNKLIDEIGSLENATEDMKETYDLSSCEEVTYTYVEDSFWNTIMNAVQKLEPLSGSSDAKLIEGLIDKNNLAPQYLCE